MIRVPAFVVIGGGENGQYVVRQLLRAVTAGALETGHIFVVDRDPGCVVAREPDPRVRFERADWSDWLGEHLDDLSPDDHVVPYHWAPHLFFEWLARAASRAGAVADRGEAPCPPAGVPYARPSGDRDLALSYATWICPATCIEPARCPHTRGAKDWSLCCDLENAAVGLEDAVVTVAEGAVGADDRLVFKCLHLVYGVGTVPVAALLAARNRVLSGLRTGPRRYLVATSSHCHALAATLEVRRAG